jgi:hypothetical protein
MNDGAPQVFALALLLVGMISGSLTHAQEMFKLLSEKDIRARVIGKDCELSPAGWRALRQRNGQ